MAEDASVASIESIGVEAGDVASENGRPVRWVLPILALALLAGCARQAKPTGSPLVNESSAGEVPEGTGNQWVPVDEFSAEGNQIADAQQIEDTKAEASRVAKPLNSQTLDETSSIVRVSFPSDPLEAFRQAVAAMELGPRGYSRALELLEHAIRLNPDFWEAYFDAGWLYQRLGRQDDAEEAYRRTLKLNDSVSSAWVNLSQIKKKRGDNVAAQKILQQGLEVLPHDALLLNNHALLLRLAGQDEDAINEVKKILKINAVDVNAFNNLGRIYIGKQDFEMARLVYQKALLSAPDAKDDPYIHHNLGVTYKGLGDIRAADEFERAIALKPDLVEALVGRAYLHLEIQEYRKAADLLTRAVAVDPDSIQARIDLAVALRGLNELDRAELQYVQIQRIDPKNQIGLRNYGILLSDYRGEYGRAAAIYGKLRGLLPPGEERDRVERLLAGAERNEKILQRRADRERRRAEEKERQNQEQREREDRQKEAQDASISVGTGGADVEVPLSPLPIDGDTHGGSDATAGEKQSGQEWSEGQKPTVDHEQRSAGDAGTDPPKD